MRDLATLKLAELKSTKEGTLFPLMALFGIGGWIIIAVTLIGLLYALAVGFFVVVAHQLYLANMRGNGVRLSATQLPELHARVVAASKRLGLAQPPDTYIIQAGGVLNAMATKLFSRNFVIIYSELVEACGQDDKALDFVIGHEMGHLALGHLKWQIWLGPARIIPLLGPAYSRACEYSCDQCGVAVVADLEAAQRGLGVLAAGGKLAARISLGSFATQAEESSGFWAGVYELASTHPFLTKRVRALKEFVEPGTARAFGRSGLSYVFSPFFGWMGSLGGAAGVIVAVYLMTAMGGMLAAIAIPNFLKFQARTKQSEAKTLLRACAASQKAFFAQHQRYGHTFAEIGLAMPEPTSYSLYMGDNRIGPEREIPWEEPPGFAEDDGYACVAVGNIDSDPDLDVWFVNAEKDVPQQDVDDLAATPAF